MAHYDCSNCGESMGICFGSCSSCTPKEYHDLERSMAELRSWAENRWQAHIKAEMEALQKRRESFIDALISEQMEPLQKRMHEVKMQHHRGYRYDYERAQRTRMAHPVTGAEIHVEPGAQIPLFDKL